jgi:excisionase family DNA binding protein
MAETESNADEALTVAQAAEHLGISMRRVSKLCLEGRLGKRFGGKVYLISRQELEAFSKIPRRPGPPKGTKRKWPEKAPTREDTNEPKVISKRLNKIGNWIKEHREQRQWTQKELADKLGNTYQSDVSFWECGTHIPNTDACLKIAKVFGADIRHVLGLANETKLDRQIEDVSAR